VFQVYIDFQAAVFRIIRRSRKFMQLLFCVLSVCCSNISAIVLEIL
jgi:hypothetical protein